MYTGSLDEYLKERFLFLLSEFSLEDEEYFYTNVFKIPFGLFVKKDFVEKFSEFLFVNMTKRYPDRGISRKSIDLELELLLGVSYCLHHIEYTGPFNVMQGFLLTHKTAGLSSPVFGRWASEKPFTLLDWMIVPSVCFVPPFHASFLKGDIAVYPKRNSRVIAQTEAHGQKMMVTKHAFFRFMTRDHSAV